MSQRSGSAWLTFAGLIALIPVVGLWLLPAGLESHPFRFLLAGACALPLAIAAATMGQASKNWARYVALLMIFYIVLGVMEIIAVVELQALPLALLGLSILVFFAAVDCVRRR